MSEVVGTAVKEACPEIKGIVPAYQASDELIAIALNILRKGRNHDEYKTDQH